MVFFTCLPFESSSVGAQTHSAERSKIRLLPCILSFNRKTPKQRILRPYPPCVCSKFPLLRTEEGPRKNPEILFAHLEASVPGMVLGPAVASGIVSSLFTECFSLFDRSTFSLSVLCWIFRLRRNTPPNVNVHEQAHLLLRAKRGSVGFTIGLKN